MANKGTPTIIEGKKHFQSFIYEGNGGGQRVGRFIPFTDSGTIAKSCIFNDDDTPTLSRTIGSASSTTTFTISCWVKRGNTGLLRGIWSREGANDNNELRLYFDSSNRLNWSYYPNGDTAKLTTNRTFEDTSKWYHIVAVSDTGNSTEAYRWRLYVDGDEISSFATSTYPSQSTSIALFSSDSYSEYIGRARSVSTTSFDGYLAEFNIVDGSALTPSTFGLTDTSTGRWIPKTLTGITYGNTGNRLTFENNVAIQNIGYDTSGNGNNFTVSNLAIADVVPDSPTQNYATLSPFVISNAPTLSQGHLKALASTNLKYGMTASTLSWDTSDTTGYYAEFRKNDSSSIGASFFNIGCVHTDGKNSDLDHSNADNPTDGSLVWYENGNMSISTRGDGTRLQPGAGHIGAYGNTGDIMMIAAKGNQVYFGNASKGVWYSAQGAGQTGNPATGVGGFTLEKKGRWHFIITTGYNSSAGSRADGTANFGQNPTFSGSITAVANTDGSGSLFKYTPPTGYKALMQDNLPLASSPNNEFVDIAWIKNQDAGDYQQIYDSSRGPLKKIGMFSSDIAQQATTDDGLQKFLPKGFEIEDNDAINTVGEKYVAWTWHVNAGTTSANSDGSGASIASTIQANQDAGISIVTYDGSGSSGTIAHGLSQAPDVMFIKNITSTGSTGANIDWVCYHHKLPTPETGYIVPSRNYAKNNFGTDDYFGNTNPTNKVFHVAADVHTNAGGGAQYLAYCWHEVDGYSMMGEYEGNGNVNGPFIYTGFLPQYLWIKNIDNSTDWYVYNFASDIHSKNEYDKHFFWSNSTQTQQTGSEEVDLLSNGFKLRGNNSGTNQDGYTFVYMAFAEFPFVGNAVSPLPAQ